MDKMEKHKLKSLILKNFKSIGKEEQKIEFGDINVLIGANGVGKSNLVSFFQLLNHLTTDALQLFIGKSGYADSILYYGTKESKSFDAKLDFANTSSEHYIYEFSLSHSHQGQMMFANEQVKNIKKNHNKINADVVIGKGHQESKLQEAGVNNKTAKAIHDILKNCFVYQFSDTSENAGIRKPVNTNEAKYLRNDADNLATFLYAMKFQYPDYYERIENRISKIMPQFHEFALEPLANNQELIRLDWIDSRNKHQFGPSQISDGSLRFMALASLLLQPADKLPNVIVIDEPELGLHPEALLDLIGMIKIASQNCQIILATQSPYLVDLMEVDQVIVVERKNDGSVFRHLSTDNLQEWLNDYSISELWDKNLIGGRP